MVVKRKYQKALGYNKNNINHDLEIVKTYIHVDNLKRDYIFWQISDSHISYTNKKKLLDLHAKRNAWWTLDGYDDPLFSLDTIIKESQNHKLDGLIVCGDFIDFYSKDSIKYATKKLKEFKTQKIITLGNHEKTILDSKKSDINFNKNYKSWSKNNFSQSLIDYGDFAFLIVDDSKQTITKEQYEYVKSLQNLNKPIFLVIHIPIITDEMAPKCMEVWGPTFMLGTDICDETTKEFVNYVKSEQSNIHTIFAGHLHYESVSEFKKGAMQYCTAPSFLGYIREIIITSK